jgi:endonuclease YncB( thermonuclease family)
MGKVTGFHEINRQVAKYRYFSGFPVLFSSLVLALAISFSIATKAIGEETTQVEKNCEASDNCRNLNNDKADYNLIEAKVVEITDADTMKLELYYWPQHTITTSVRLKGVDTPELDDAKCLKEKLLSEEAKSSIEQKLPVGSWVVVSDVSFDKYGGRYVADVRRWRSDRLSSINKELLSNSRWAVVYNGEKKVHDWCVAE